jgi:hypothetical protein
MDKTQLQKAKEDMTNLTEARLLSFLKEMRKTDNEWMLEEMFEFGDEVQLSHRAMFEAGLIEKEHYQQVVAIARLGWAQLKNIVTAVEKICLRNPKVFS